MRKTISLGILFLTLSMSLKAETEEFRIWKTVNGNQVEAKYMGHKYGNVKLKTKTGKFLMVKESSLVAADKIWIKKHEATSGNGTAIKAASSENLLPIFSGGRNNGYYAVYRADKFDACMKENGRIDIYPKSKGIRVGKPIEYFMQCYYYFGDSGHDVREIKCYYNNLKPVEQPKMLTFIGELEDNVKFTVTYEFAPNGIKSYGYCKDPAGIKHETVFRIRADVQELYKIEEKPADINKKMDGWKLEITPIAGKKLKYPYTKAISILGMDSKKVVINAPVYGDRKISFKTGKPADAPIVPYIYTSNYPWQGYTIQVIKKKNDKKSKSEYFQMLIE